MPINKVYDIKLLIDTVKDYISLTNRRVTFEYIMIDGVNDSISCANELSALLKGINCYVNLIPYNETNNLSFKKSFFFTSRRRHTRWTGDWSSDVCSSD